MVYGCFQKYSNNLLDDLKSRFCSADSIYIYIHNFRIISILGLACLYKIMPVRNPSIFIPLPIEQVGLCTPFCSIKWVPTTKWVCTPQLLVSTKWLHTPSDVLMLNVLLEWVCNPFCRKWVYRHVCSPTWSLQNGLY